MQYQHISEMSREEVIQELRMFGIDSEADSLATETLQGELDLQRRAAVERYAPRLRLQNIYEV